MNKEVYRKDFTVGPGTILKVYHGTGGIIVNSWDRDYIEVVAVKQLRWWTGFLKGPDIDVAAGKEFVIRTLYKKFIFRAIPLQYRITVPKGVRVAHVETSTGGLQIREVKGFLEAVTSTGKIDLNGVSGDVDAKTSTGEIQIHKADGFVKAVTSNGKIVITGVGGLSGARTDTGNISVEVPAIRDNLEIRSSTGSIKFSLPRGLPPNWRRALPTDKLPMETCR